MTLHQRQLEHLEQQAQDYLGGLKDEFREKGIEARLCIAHGSVEESILSTASSEEATVMAGVGWATCSLAVWQQRSCGGLTVRCF
jgi:hypothetical protein